MFYSADGMSCDLKKCEEDCAAVLLSFGMVLLFPLFLLSTAVLHLAPCGWCCCLPSFFGVALPSFPSIGVVLPFLLFLRCGVFALPSIRYYCCCYHLKDEYTFTMLTDDRERHKRRQHHAQRRRRRRKNSTTPKKQVPHNRTREEKQHHPEREKNGSTIIFTLLLFYMT